MGQRTNAQRLIIETAGPGGVSLSSLPVICIWPHDGILASVCNLRLTAIVKICLPLCQKAIILIQRNPLIDAINLT